MRFFKYQYFTKSMRVWSKMLKEQEIAESLENFSCFFFLSFIHSFVVSKAHKTSPILIKPKNTARHSFH